MNNKIVIVKLGTFSKLNSELSPSFTKYFKKGTGLNLKMKTSPRIRGVICCLL